MTNFIPIFPLGIVVYPGEQLNLHIFEPRYKQLITECNALKKPFGIPTVLNGAVAEMGTLISIEEISNIYDDGSMDIKTRGLEIFKVLEVIKELPDKLYSGAIVTYPVNDTSMPAKNIMTAILKAMREVYLNLDISKDFNKADAELVSYDIAHHVGMSLEDEYLLLQLMNELQRQEFIKRHLAKVVPVMSELNALKKKIKLNGHFKNLHGFKFP